MLPSTKFFSRGLLILSVVSLTVLTACQKDNDGISGEAPNGHEKVDNPQVKENFMELKGELPKVGVYNKKMDKMIVFDPNDTENKDFSFSDPNPGWNFSDNSEVEYVQYQGGGLLFVGPGSFGGNTGGGTVVAGNSELNISHTFCFSASEEAIGLDLFAFGDDIDGVSSVVGIAGDFEALQNQEIDEDAEYTDYFQGFAVYIVYDNEASGSYEVLDWFQDLEQDEEDLQGVGFSYVIDFQELGIYFSSEGNLSVSGGTIDFNGQYFAFLDLFEDMLNGEEGDDIELYEVEGYGAMGCN